MNLYLLRHAIAVPRGTPGYPNDDRPLTDDGRAKMVEAARGFRHIITDLELILTSPLIRARDTAIIASDALMKVPVEIFEPLSPNSSPSTVFSALGKFRRKERIMLVGHEPSLSTLSALLIGTSLPFIEFKKGGICRIDIDHVPPGGAGSLIWHLTPKILKRMG
ncbi:MAG: phosphohistidine phosphatase SixA [Bacteroidota bacterium]